LIAFLMGTLLADDTPAGSSPPKGELRKYTFEQNMIFPGTMRDYSIHVPKQYDPAKPACLYVNQDGVLAGVSPGSDLRRAG
jgi:gluconolactonase